MSSTEEVLTRECRQRLSDKAQAVAKKYGCYWVGYFNFNCFSKINIPSSKIYYIHETISWIGKDSYQTNDTVVTGATTTTTGKSTHEPDFLGYRILGESKESSNTQYQTKNVTNTHYVSVTKTKTIYLYYVLVNDKESFDKLVYYRDNFKETRNQMREATRRPMQKMNFLPYFKKWAKEKWNEDIWSSLMMMFFFFTRFFSCFYPVFFAVLTLISAAVALICSVITAIKENDRELLGTDLLLIVPVLFALVGNREAVFTENILYNIFHAGMFLVSAIIVIYFTISLFKDVKKDWQTHNKQAQYNQDYRGIGMSICEDIREIERHLS